MNNYNNKILTLKIIDYLLEYDKVSDWLSELDDDTISKIENDIESIINNRLNQKIPKIVE